MLLSSIDTSRIVVVKSMIKEEVNGIKRTYNPEENKIEQNFSRLGFLSANLPPRWYPPLRPTKTTPIKLPQVYIELPKTGINNLLAANSKDIVVRPAINTRIKSIVKADKCAFNINISYFTYYWTYLSSVILIKSQISLQFSSSVYCELNQQTKVNLKVWIIIIVFNIFFFLDLTK